MALLVCAAMVSAKGVSEFPLWGSDWVIAQGTNKRVYPSVLRLEPRKVMRLRFTNDHKVKMAWVNLDHRDYWGTADMLEETVEGLSWRGASENQKDVGSGEINSGRWLDIGYQTYDDSVWSVNQALLSALRSGKYVAVVKVQQGEEREYTRGRGETALRAELDDGSAYSRSQPYGIGKRRRTRADREIYTVWIKEGDGREIWMKEADDPTVAEQDYMDEELVYEHIWDREVKTAGLGYWQVHAHPEIAYFPRDPDTGEPIIADELKMDKATALAKRSASIDDPLNIEKKAYRNPYLSDSASVIVSFAFVDDGGRPIRVRDWVWLSGSAAGSQMEYEHTPGKMFRVIGGESGLEEAVTQLYAEGPEEEVFARTLNSRCPGWKMIDRINAAKLFPVERREDGKLERDWSVEDGNYMYDGCPCMHEARLGGLTKVQVRRFLYQALPNCRYYDMKRAWWFNARVSYYMTEKGDRRQIASNLRALSEIMERRQQIYGSHPEAGAQRATVENARCARTWVDEPFVEQIIGRIQDVVP